MERLMAQLAAELDDSEAVESTSHTSWSIYLEEKIEVQLHTLENESAYFLFEVGKTPVETDALERLLLANCMGKGTFDAILGVDDKGEQVVLRRPLAANCTYRELRETLEDFYNAALFWKKELPTLGAVQDLQALAQLKATT